MKSQITINFNNVKGLFLKNKIRTIFSNALKQLNIAENVTVNITFLSVIEIQNLNLEYRKIEKPTDVLSFPIYNLNYKENLQQQLIIEKQNEQDDITNAKMDIGDIAICEAVAKLQAKKLKHSLKREIYFLALHGLLHLLGFDHIEAEDEKVMIKMQKEILQISMVKDE